MALFDPAHPGELIRETLDGIYEETGKRLTVEQVANALGTTRKTLSSIINGKSAISPEMAIRLGTAFPNTTPEFWLSIQENYNLAQARKRVDISTIKVIWQPNAV